MCGILYAFYMATFSAYAYTYFLFVWRQIVFCTAFGYCITCERVSTKISEARIGSFVQIKREPLGPAVQHHNDSVSSSVGACDLMTATVLWDVTSCSLVDMYSVVGCDVV